MAVRERKGVRIIQAGEAAMILVGGKLDMTKARDILRRAGGHVAFIQLHHGLPIHVSPDEIEKRLAVVLSHLLSERGGLDSDVRGLYDALAKRVTSNVAHDVVSESYRLVLLVCLTSEKSGEESEEMFMARAVAQNLRIVFEREEGVAFSL